ncbi:MAG: M18 family aminopeptidase [Deltaproteobacteria bacterium]|nr:M18 family aminopeptidase [Deltaproteobacteria bacterium]
MSEAQEQSQASPLHAEGLSHDLIRFIHRSPTPYHAVAECARRLDAAGFRQLSRPDYWSLSPGERAYATFDDSTLVAFHVGVKSPTEAGFRIVGAHTDSPTLKLKSIPETRKHGYRQIGVEVYGGALLSTWFDRDLSLAGRVMVKTGEGAQSTRLIDFGRPVARIPSLAIHLNREVNREGLKINPQDHLAPLLGMASSSTPDPVAAFRAMLAEQAQVAVEDVLDHDLMLYDTQAPTLGGLDEAFIYAARLDNLASCHAAMTALLATSSAEAWSRPAEATRVIALYDNEEVGSRSARGAQGPFLETVLQRIIECRSTDTRQAFPRAMASSFFTSVDMAHGVHPNYADRHDGNHLPSLGGGPVIKANANQSYATDSAAAARFTAACRAAGFEPQRFVSRADMPCGSTIGPITAARLGIQAVDVGSPMLSMHSCREMAGAADVAKMHDALVGMLTMPFV